MDLKKHNHVEYIGSQDTTTCCILLLRNIKLDRVACVHLDGSDYPLALLNAIKRTLVLEKDKDNILEAYIVGYYMDERYLSIDNVSLMLHMMYESSITFLIKCCHILDLNTTRKQVTVDARFHLENELFLSFNTLKLLKHFFYQ